MTAPTPAEPISPRGRDRSLGALVAALLLVACGSDAAPCDPAATLTGGGEATWYSLGGRGACSLDLEGRVAYAAVADEEWDGSAPCGRCLEVTGPGGEVVVVKVLDRCPACAPGGLDLSPDAFAVLADPDDGRVEVRWRTVACPTAGPVRFRLEGSDEHYLKLQVANTPHGVASVALRDGGVWRELERTDDYHFAASGGIGKGPFELRVRDVHGRELVEAGIALENDRVQPGRGQFPGCGAADELVGAVAAED